jgi:hypothetical protein
MGFGKFLKSFVDPETLGDEIVATQVRVYLHLCATQPKADPHLMLAETWLQRVRLHGNDTRSEQMQILSFSETCQFACLPPPTNARALGLHFVYKERPDIMQRFPKFAREFGEIMAPVMQAINEGRFEELYSKYNPALAETVPPPLPAAPKPSVFDSRKPRQALLDEIQAIGGPLIVNGYRRVAAERGCAPTSKTSDAKILEIYASVGVAFHGVAKERGEVISAEVLHRIVLFFLQQLEMMGEAFVQSHLEYELDKFRHYGLRDEYREPLKLL